MQVRGILLAYIAGIYVAAAAAVAAVVAVDATLDRAWLAAVVAAVIALGHLGETRILRRGNQGEVYSHEETYVVLLALLASPLVAVAAVAAGFAGGNVIARREPVKAVFNVGAMTLAAAVSMLVFAAVAPADAMSAGGAVAAAAAVVVFYVANRLLIAGVFAIVGAASFRDEISDDLAARAVVLAADAGIGLLAAFAVADRMWTLPAALAALAAVHYALSGHAVARAERQKLANVIDSSSDGIVSVGRNGRIVSWNPAAEALTGYGAREMLGAAIDDVARLLEAGEQSLADDSAREVSVVVRTKTGEPRWLDVRRTPTPEGGRVLVLRDETRRRELEALRAREERDRLRADLIAAVSHELRTPLASMLGFTQTLLARETTPEQRTRFLEIIREQGERLGELIDDLLDLRIVGERGTRATDVFDLRELLDEQVTEFAARAPAHRLRLVAPAAALYVRGDRGRLRQVLSNLVSNAIKYSPHGGAVEVRAASVDDRVRIDVVDEGLGIPSPVQAHVFEPFFRVEDAGRAGIGGSGLGLALAREIVRAHGGEIRVESVEGAGSTFSFELPRAATPSAVERPSHAAAEG